MSQLKLRPQQNQMRLLRPMNRRGKQISNRIRVAGHQSTAACSTRCTSTRRHHYDSGTSTRGDRYTDTRRDRSDRIGRDAYRQ
jgi:hypothetical protein